MKNNSKTFREVSKQKMIEQGLNVVAGVDLGDKHSHVCLIDLDGKIVERKKLSTSPAAFERYFGGWAAMRVVLEAGCHANWIYRLHERLGLERQSSDDRGERACIRFLMDLAEATAQLEARTLLSEIQI